MTNDQPDGRYDFNGDDLITIQTLKRKLSEKKPEPKKVIPEPKESA